MFAPWKNLLLCVIGIINSLQSCTSEPIYPPTLTIHSNETEYTDVVVRREHENVTLICEFKGDSSPRHFVWNYVSNGTSGQSPYTTEPVGLTTSSRLIKPELSLADSGEYMCSSPPFSVTKYLLVQKAPSKCGVGSFACGDRCVMPFYVCDGRTDCLHGEDEDTALCHYNVCSRAGKLNCSAGRCISIGACCRAPGPLCSQPSCCDQLHAARQLGMAEEYPPPLFEDRHAPDDYGFIQSTIYTVTACALIFMIAVVLLVSAICKMHMKRAALRGYTHADRAARQHYSQQYAQAHRFPPCYEASRLLEESRTNGSPQQSPVHVATTPTEILCVEESPVEPPRGLARLSSIFSSRYRQVPAGPEPLELQCVGRGAVGTGGAGVGGGGSPLHEYRSPTFADNNAEFLFTDPDSPDFGRDLNYMATPIEFFRRRTMRRNTLERVIDQLDRQRLTLQLGRFQLSLPRLGRAPRPAPPRAAPRPDTPNVAEISVHDLDFVRLSSNDTYTLNGRTIHLLGADFEDYPVLPDGTQRPPSYTEAVRYKLYGPPPEYLSRDGLNRQSADQVDQEATSNVEMPPCYDELNQNDDNGNTATANTVTAASNDNNDVDNNGITGITENNGVASENSAANNGSNANNDNACANSDIVNGNDLAEELRLNTATNVMDRNIETLSSIIDNLPAIDSDLNANDNDIFVRPVNQNNNAV